jgi:D-sedoheptulose 7-phosphate isomerase
MSTLDAVRASFVEAKVTLDAFLADDANTAAVARFAELCHAALVRGNKLMACGNGGSMCDAMHFAEEWTGRFRGDRAALPAIAFSDPSQLTCIANDFGYDEVFARSVEAYGKTGDVLVVLSTSGNSPNVIKAVQRAKQMGVTRATARRKRCRPRIALSRPSDRRPGRRPPRRPLTLRRSQLRISRRPRPAGLVRCRQPGLRPQARRQACRPNLGRRGRRPWPKALSRRTRGSRGGQRVILERVPPPEHRMPPRRRGMPPGPGLLAASRRESRNWPMRATLEARRGWPAMIQARRSSRPGRPAHRCCPRRRPRSPRRRVGRCTALDCRVRTRRRILTPGNPPMEARTGAQPCLKVKRGPTWLPEGQGRKVRGRCSGG